MGVRLMTASASVSASMRPIVVVPGGDAVPGGDVARPFRRPPADGDQLGLAGQPVHLRQVIALGDVAAAEEGQLHGGHGLMFRRFTMDADSGEIADRNACDCRGRPSPHRPLPTAAGEGSRCRQMCVSRLIDFDVNTTLLPAATGEGLGMRADAGNAHLLRVPTRHSKPALQFLRLPGAGGLVPLLDDLDHVGAVLTGDERVLAAARCSRRRA